MLQWERSMRIYFVHVWIGIHDTRQRPSHISHFSAQLGMAPADLPRYGTCIHGSLYIPSRLVMKAHTGYGTFERPVKWDEISHDVLFATVLALCHQWL